MNQHVTGEARVNLEVDSLYPSYLIAARIAGILTGALTLVTFFLLLQTAHLIDVHLHSQSPPVRVSS
jgi:hypothetical protein